LTGYENHHPHNESLGFRFRISLARALAVNPEFILLDDPFKRMSSITKDEIYELLRSIEEKFKVSFILATTNIAEAVYLSNKIFLMKKNPGKIIEEIKLDAETLRKKGLNSHERFISLRNEIEKSFQASGETLQTEVHH
jgi:ABC-type nitrate/sulfonate/bicarbonate transport system ATPase subunit